MQCALTQCGWFAVAIATMAFAPITNPIIVPNHLASNSPSGVNIFLAFTAAHDAEPALTQLCWGGERGLFSKTFRITSLRAADADGKPIVVKPLLSDANHAAWRDAANDAAPIGSSLPAFSMALVSEPANAIASAAKIEGTLELKLGKSVIRVGPESREKNQFAQCSLLEAKGLKLVELGQKQRFNLQFSYSNSNEKKGALLNLFFVDSSGKPFYSSKPRVDGLGMVKILPTENIPPDAKIRVGLDKNNLIPDAIKLFQSKELLSSALNKRGIRINEYACRTTHVFEVEMTRAPSNLTVPELVLDYAGKRIKGVSAAVASQQDPTLALNTVWSFDVPADLLSQRPDILVLLPGDDGVRAIQFEFHDAFATKPKPQ